MANEVPSVLLKICEKKKPEVDTLYRSGLADRYKQESFDQPPTRNFAGAISKPGMNLIAEFKRASPSKGDIRPGVEPEGIVKLYEESGASAISVLTDSHFKGEVGYLKRVRDLVDIPLLRKDFIIDSSQIYEARTYGADAILLISAILDPSQIEDYIGIAKSLGMDCLVESHDEGELEKAISGKSQIFGVNNRNLHNFSTDRNTTLRLLENIPEGYPIVTESAILTYDHVRELSHPRVNAMLVGEAIMSAKTNPTLSDMQGKIYELLGKQ